MLVGRVCAVLDALQTCNNLHFGRFDTNLLVVRFFYDEDGTVFAGMGTDFADYDNDGLPDVFVNALANQGYALFRNTKGLLEYVSGLSGLSSVTKVHSGWHWGIRPYLSAADKRAHFGLGREDEVKLLEIRWPSGVVQTWKNIAVSQILVAKEAAQ
ncbi:MAG TPA: ASPIC/UnbV domain-containing protein [Bryobacteraceae bacterium]|nr:ASPIC/UnbV domain-containing protein [Bryobacteraceae bacterium]